MPDRPGLDDDEALKELIEIWRSGSADLDDRYNQVVRSIKATTERIGTDPNARNAVRRLRVEASRLTELSDVASGIVDDAAQGTDRFISEGGFDRIYAAGAGRVESLPFSFTAPHRAAVEVLARDTFDDVLVATSFVDADSKDFVRRVSRKLTGFKLTSGTPVKTQARRLSQDLAKDFRARGVGAITYADGSRRSFGDYAEMLLRTKTGVAYNAGTMNQGRQAGIEFYELLDGALCGLTSHNDDPAANGLIVRFEIAAGFPLSHPNCRRSVNPRPDITSANQADAISVQAPEAREDQRRFEEALRAQSASRQARRRPARASRSRPGRSRPQRPRRATRTARGRQDAAARQEARAGNARRRARIEQIRAESVRAQTRIAEQRSAAHGVSGDVDAELLRRWAVTEDQFLNARALASKVRKDIRDVASREADSIGAWLLDSDLATMTRPRRLASRTDISTGRRSRVRQQSGYDFMERLDDAELRRVRKRFTDSDLYAPDVVAEQVRRKTNLDLSDDEAIEWLLDRWMHEDALRSVASGRLPRYANPDNLIPSEYAMEGYDLSKLFGVDLDEAAGHIAQVQAAAGEQAAARILGTPRYGPAPWTMDAADYVLELEQIEDLFSAVTPETRGSDVLEQARLRLRELAPPDIDLDGSTNPYELHEQIRLLAQTAALF